VLKGRSSQLNYRMIARRKLRGPSHNAGIASKYVIQGANMDRLPSSAHNVALLPGQKFLRNYRLEIHAAHATLREDTPGAGVLLRHFGHHGFGGDQKRRHRGSVLDRGADDLGRVDDALMAMPRNGGCVLLNQDDPRSKYRL
jgi:hypothetical protein